VLVKHKHASSYKFAVECTDKVAFIPDNGAAKDMLTTDAAQILKE
jgi:hypothetical protein